MTSGGSEPAGFESQVRDAGQGGHAVVVPREIAALFPGRKVLAEVNGEPYESRLATYSGKSFLGLRQSLLKTIGAATGDTVRIVLREAPAEVEAPVPTAAPALDALLASDDGFRTAFEALPVEHRDEYRRWIAATEDPEAQSVRIERLRRRLTLSAE